MHRIERPTTSSSARFKTLAVPFHPQSPNNLHRDHTFCHQPPHRHITTSTQAKHQPHSHQKHHHNAGCLERRDRGEGTWHLPGRKPPSVAARTYNTTLSPTNKPLFSSHSSSPAYSKSATSKSPLSSSKSSPRSSDRVSRLSHEHLTSPQTVTDRIVQIAPRKPSPTASPSSKRWPALSTAGRKAVKLRPTRAMTRAVA
jgi:hypothetical protein